MSLVRAVLPKRFSIRGLVPLFLVFVTVSLILVQFAHLYSNRGLLPETPIKVGTNTEGLDDIINESIKQEHESENYRPESSNADKGEDDKYSEFYSEDYEFDTSGKTVDSTANVDDLIKKDSKFKKFINEEILRLIMDSSPSVPAINNKAHYNKDNKNRKTGDYKLPVIEGKLRENNIVDPLRSKDYLSSFMKIAQNEKSALKESHDSFLKKLPSGYPKDIKFSGNGILYAGGGNYNWLVLVSLKMLRDTGSKLPVEVFIPTEAEYSVDLCDHVFPILGAKCILMSSTISNKLNFKLKGYQLKSMALMLSSFENILLLDSDNIPVKNPDHIFVNEPFKSTGMVVWPDFWRRSTSPEFYDIAGIKVNEMNQVRFSYGDERDHPPNTNTLEDYNANISYHDLEGTFPESSSESGQLLINKNTHARAIFLSLYYNYYGPQYYYGLMSQGQAGEGDKETYLAAAHQLGMPYYQVQEFIREYGLIRDDGGIDIASMGQYDPVIDAIQSANPEKYKSNFPYDSSKDNYQLHRYNKSSTLFLHCNEPKLYPWKVRGKGLQDLLDAKDGRRRIYSHYLTEELGFDLEMKIMKTLQWILCEHGDLNIKGMRDPDQYCKKVQKQVEFLMTDVEKEGQDAPHLESEGRLETAYDSIDLVSVDNISGKEGTVV
jgi:alpha 1,2-mannosyltransferase